MPGVSPDQVRLSGEGLADTDPLATVQDSLTEGVADPSYMTIGKSVALASVGGALVGFLASGGKGWRGAAIGASVNATLVYAGTAIAGRKAFSKGMLALLVALGIATASSAGYLFMQQRKRR